MFSILFGTDAFPSRWCSKVFIPPSSRGS